MTTLRRMSLLEVIVVTLAIAAACAMPAASQPAATPSLDVVVGSAPGDELAFVPDSIAAPPAALIQVTFRNDSDQAHNLTFQAPLSAATRTIVEAGASDVAVFTTPGSGSYEFVCTIHMGMTGTLTIE